MRTFTITAVPFQLPPAPRKGATVSLELQPITFSEAAVFINEHHRHHVAPIGHKFSIGINDGEKVVGVAVVSRPTARMSDDGYTAEVTRLCVLEGIKNGCSMLYQACWRAARAMGYHRLITYTLASESGSSLRASGWVLIGEAGGGSWSRQERLRVDKHPLQGKLRWEAVTPAGSARAEEGRE